MPAHATERGPMPTLAHDTSNDLPKDVRGQVVELLNQRLADAIDLETQTKQAHWNVKGAQFIALHKLFDEIYQAVEEYVDLLAERVVQLGGIAEGTVRVVAERSELTDYPRRIADGPAHWPSSARPSAARSTRRTNSATGTAPISVRRARAGCACRTRPARRRGPP